ncbi:MAG: hypothetical protein AB1489_41895 [Acidobacteriota bacterium]
MSKALKFAMLIIASISLILLVRPIKADSDAELSASYSWSVTGPFGGNVRSLTIDPANPQRLYLGTDDGQIYRSTDAANNWQRLVSFNQPGYVVDKLIIDETDTKTIYAPLWFLANDIDGTIFKSTDGGDSWRELVGMRNHSIRALAIAPSNHKILIAAAIDGAYQSDDGGTTWRLISPPNHPDIRRLHSVAIDPKTASIIYLGTEHLPWKTEDGGQSWVSIKGHPSERKLQLIDDSDIFSIVIDRRDTSRVYCSACSGIYRSLDAARTWSKFQGIPYNSRRTHLIYPHPVNPDTIYAGTTEGLWKTTNGGQSWQVMTSLQTIVNTIAIHPSQPDRVYIGIKSGGVLVSDDGGARFQAVNNGFVNRQISTLLADRKVKGRIYAGVLFNGHDSGLYISNDNGLSWRAATRGLEGQDVYVIYQSAAQERIIFAGTNAGLYRSTDQGESWIQIKSTGVAKPVSVKKGVRRSKALPINLNSRVTDIAPLHNKQGGLLVASWSGLFRVEENGSGLEHLNIGNYQGRVLAVSTHPQKSELIYAGTTTGLQLSLDSGKTWQLITVTSEEETTPVVQAIGVSPRDANLLLVGTQRACYLSTDGGKNWQRRGRGIPYGEVLAVRFSNTNPDLLAVGNYKTGGVFLSTNGGESFRRIDYGLPSVRVGALSFDSFNTQQLYVGSFSGGVYVLKVNNLTSSK